MRFDLALKQALEDGSSKLQFYKAGLLGKRRYEIKKPDMSPAFLVCTPTEIIQQLFSREAWQQLFWLEQLRL